MFNLPRIYLYLFFRSNVSKYTELYGQVYRVQYTELYGQVYRVQYTLKIVPLEFTVFYWLDSLLQSNFYDSVKMESESISSSSTNNTLMKMMSLPSSRQR